jgi:hypothetical protein
MVQAATFGAEGRTTVTRRWIAEKLRVGYETRVSQAVSWVKSSRAREVVEMRTKLTERGSRP